MSIMFSKNEIVHALSWNQPFASLMLHGKVETRRRPTNVRGWVLICAAATSYTFDQVDKISGIEQCDRIDSLLQGDNIELGKAIAIGKLVDCRAMTVGDEKRCFVKYQQGLWCWYFEDVKEIEPFSWKGKQGWSILTEDQKAMIKLI